ncbi:UNVERIFIED_CONTAM: hypothetical protein Slati_2885800 [Sesamum latifolium]|uniref:Retrotransposon gag domain-containing protein n=1 Tax=Sesamum latifolium TaxID=2727402 RepID=A0AAW2VFR9_9LAMI
METPSNAPNKQKAGEAPAAATQALQVVQSASMTSLFGTTATTTSRSTDPATDTSRTTITPDAPPVELPESPRNSSADDYLSHSRATDTPRPCPGDLPPQWLARLESLQKGLQDVQYQRTLTPPIYRNICPNSRMQTPAIAENADTSNPQEHLSQFENATLLHRYTDGIKCRVFITTFAWAAQQWFNQLSPAVIGSFREFRSLFLNQFASSRKHRKTELSLFSIRQKEEESLKDYQQRFNTAALEILSATQEVKVSACVQG